MKDKISIITTLYKSEKYIDEFYKRITQSIQNLNCDYEIIFVNDGSPDESLPKSLKLRDKDTKVKIINLSKNYGQHIAILSGIIKSDGDYSFVIDIDLEESPELIEEFYNKIINSDFDIIYGIRKDITRKGFIQKIFRKIFWTVFRMISDCTLKNNISNVRIFNKNFCNALKKHQERGWIMSTMTQICGFKQGQIVIDRIYKGNSSYTNLSKLKFLFSHILNYSNKPLYAVTYVGLFISAISFGFGLYFIIKKLLFNISVDGWTSIMVSIWLLGGIIILFLGIIGIYIANIFVDVKNRPLFLIKDELGFMDND